MVPAIRRRSRPRVESTTIRRAIRRSRCRVMGPWIGPRIQGSAAIIRIAMSVTVPTAKDRDRHGNPDRKSTRLNSSHSQISYAVFCLKKNKIVVIGAVGARRLGGVDLGAAALF